MQNELRDSKNTFNETKTPVNVNKGTKSLWTFGKKRNARSTLNLFEYVKIPVAMQKFMMYVNNENPKFWKIMIKGSTYSITQGKAGTVGKTAVRKFSSRKECLRQADKLIYRRMTNDYIECQPLTVKPSALPQGLLQGLARKRTITTGRSIFTIHPLNDVKHIAVVLYEPNGWYCAPAYALGTTPGTYAHDIRTLVYLPHVKRYALYHRASRQLTLLNETSWASLCRNLPHHLDQDPNLSPNHTGRRLRFDFVPDDLPHQSEAILALPDKTRIRQAKKFIGTWEPVLQQNPFCPEMRQAYMALVNVYYHLGQWLEEDRDYDQASQWLERSLLIVKQSPELCTHFSDIFLQLGFCYSELARFDQAISHIDVYQAYNRSGWDGCNQIKASIYRVQQLHKDVMSEYLHSVKEKAQTDTNISNVDDVIRHALASRPEDPILHFNLACYYATSRSMNKALHHLEQALRTGYRSREKILWEPDLNCIRKSKRFEAIRLKYI